MTTVLLLCVPMIRVVGTAENTRMTGPAPVAATVDPNDIRYTVRGIGGNYCFSVNTPVTQYTLEALRPTFARIEMKLSLVSPASKDGALGPADWTVAITGSTGWLTNNGNRLEQS